jgi:hypothetical protein
MAVGQPVGVGARLNDGAAEPESVHNRCAEPGAAPSSHPGEWRRGARTARPTARNAHCRKPARRSAGVLAGQQQRTALCDETAIGIGDRTDGEF